MQPHEFLKQISDRKGYLRTAAIDVIERISNKDFNLLMAGFATAIAERQYSVQWYRSDKIKHVLRYKGPCRSQVVINEMERLDGGHIYPQKERAAVQATLGVLVAHGKINRTFDREEKPMYSL